MNTDLLNIIACPVCKGRLDFANGGHKPEERAGRRRSHRRHTNLRPLQRAVSHRRRHPKPAAPGFAGCLSAAGRQRGAFVMLV